MYQAKLLLNEEDQEYTIELIIILTAEKYAFNSVSVSLLITISLSSSRTTISLVFSHSRMDLSCDAVTRKFPVELTVIHQISAW